MEGRRCVVTLMTSAKPRALTFDSGHPQGLGGFLFAGAVDRKDLPDAQRKANADVGENFALELKR